MRLPASAERAVCSCARVTISTIISTGGHGIRGWVCDRDPWCWCWEDPHLRGRGQVRDAAPGCQVEADPPPVLQLWRQYTGPCRHITTTANPESALVVVVPVGHGSHTRPVRIHAEAARNLWHSSSFACAWCSSSSLVQVRRLWVCNDSNFFIS